jgi:hypothetical protein
MNTTKIISASVLSALLTVSALAAVGSSAVFAQSDDMYDNDDDRDDDQSGHLQAVHRFPELSLAFKTTRWEPPHG